MAEHIDKEIEAIKAVLNALDPLTPDVRAHVLEYVAQRLQIVAPVVAPVLAPRAADERFNAPAGVAEVRPTVHIKDLTEQKKPRSASEMAAIVAFFLENLAPEGKRKDAISTQDIKTYFKIADFPLPTKIQFTLPNAKAAGYLDAVGNGAYKLNAVGHNLVVHSMPRGAEGKTTPTRRPGKRVRRPAKR